MSPPSSTAPAHDFTSTFSAELTHKVLSHLTARDLSTCSLLNKRWHHLIATTPPTPADYARLYFPPALKRVYVNDVLGGTVNRLGFLKKFGMLLGLDPGRVDELGQWEVEVDLYEGVESHTETQIREYYANHGSVTINRRPKEQAEADLKRYFNEVEKCFDAGKLNIEPWMTFWKAYETVGVYRYYAAGNSKPEWTVVWVYTEHSDDFCTFHEDSTRLVMVSRGYDPGDRGGVKFFVAADFYPVEFLVHFLVKLRQGDPCITMFEEEEDEDEDDEEEEDEEEEVDDDDATVAAKNISKAAMFRVSRDWAHGKGLTGTFEALAEETDE
ncbi:hypothetical protein HDU96_009371 [Phlyctochytrium bullatum]|nr:hypothetical protein HDU96_009371 [Phlyctochytrium bullatum]